MIELLPAWFKAGIAAAGFGALPVVAQVIATGEPAQVADLHTAGIALLGAVFGILAYFVRRTVTGFEVLLAKQDTAQAQIIGRLDTHGKSIAVMESMVNISAIKEWAQIQRAQTELESEVKGLREWRHSEQNTVQAMLLDRLKRERG